MDWNMIGALGQWAGAVATFIAVVVAIKRPKIKLKTKFIYKTYTDNIPKIVVSNCSSRAVVIDKAIINYGKNMLNSIEFIDDDYTGEIKEITIKSGEMKSIDLNKTLLYKPIGHVTDVDEENKNYKIVMYLKDVEGRKYKVNTDFTFCQYVNILEEGIKIDNQKITLDNNVEEDKL